MNAPSAPRLYGRALPGYEERLAATVELLRDAASRHAGRIVLATSLGAEDMVLTDLVARHELPIPLATLDTGALHVQTLELLQRLQAHYGLTVEVLRPAADAVIRFVRENGSNAMYRSIELRRACCAVRKLEPLARLLQGRSAWVTGLRREQSASRARIEPLEHDEAGRTKVSPLLDWPQADVWHYIERHGVPYNPLHDRFHPSIGCAPCTRAVALGEDERSGRWWWERGAAKECGLHAPRPSVARPEEATA